MDSRRLHRGKRKDGSCWVVGYYYENCGEHCITKGSGSGIEIDPSTIGQCAGLSAAKSYRGERAEDLLIFEGDVLREGRYDFTVVYDRNWAKFKLQHDGKCIQYPEWNRGIRMGIVGTIHDTDAQEGAKPE